MVKKTLLFIILMIFIIPFSIAQTDYSRLGDNEYNGGSGFFNNVLDQADIDFTTTGISKQMHVPLVSDLDADGTKEIIVMNNDNVAIFRGTALTGVTSYDIGQSQNISNIIIHDIDGDSKLEIITYLTTSEQMLVLGFNGSHLLNESFAMSPPYVNKGDTLIGCDVDADSCLMVYSNNRGGIRENVRLLATAFDNNGFYNTTQIQYATSPTGDHRAAFCKSNWGTIEYNANDDLYTFAFSLYATHGDSGYEQYGLHLWNMRNNETHPSIINTVRITPTGFDALEIGEFCDQAAIPANQKFSNVVVADVTTSIAGNEKIVAVMEGTSEFRMYLRKSDLTAEDDYPELLGIDTQADGVLVSNLVLMDSFEDSDDGFCVMGYDNVDQQLELVCGSANSGFTDSLIYRTDIPANFNITLDDQNVLDGLIHTVETSSAYATEEVINAYGVQALDYDSCVLSALFCDLVPLYANARGKGTVVPIDYENLNAFDYLELTSTNLWYVDDGFTKSVPTLYHELDPCRDGIWKTNTTINVLITPTDPDGDTVQAMATIYQGSIYERNTSWTTLAASGTSFPFSFTANETINNGNLQLRARDSDNASDVIVDLSIYVADNGNIESGDCEETGTTSTATAATNTTATLTDVQIDYTNNAVTSGLRDTANLVGIDIFLVYMIIMFITALGIWIGGMEMKMGGSSIVGAITIMESILFIAGVYLQIIPVSIVIIIVAIVAVPLGLWVKHAITGTNQA